MKTVNAVYKRDSKNYHVFSFDHKKRIVGKVYVLMGEKVPDVLKIYLESKGMIEEQKEAETKAINSELGKRQSLKTGNQRRRRKD